MPSPLDPATSTILIVGGGTWGSSTALHLARRGYRHVTVLDAHAVPSAISAGNDINKIVEQASLPTPTDPAPTTVTNTLLAAAAAAWRSDPVFAPHHHPTGYILAASSAAALAALRAREQPSPANGFAALESAAHFRAAMAPGVLTGALPGWRGWLKRDGAGWVHARRALVGAAGEAERLGVRYVTGGPRGEVVGLVVEGGDVRGVRTRDGVVWRADRTVVCAGAWAPGLLDLEGQLRPTAWTLCHIKMGVEEARAYKDLPVLFHVER
ncbi:fructosyl amine:oxygen oxidoreductase [Neofusicoccum parvum]|uniref:Fructosyl amine:oxygen oxidoreductase n=1 Tax=Neofusicoccum parvum TaxID=310453 RepID=A0ACB5SA54_9PEZI|nr:fructosyl amine:oxygen oxidoreductase [Neofusicoccum parvum]